MNWVKKTALLVLLLMSVATLSFSQEDLRRANKYIELQDYETAINTLKRVTEVEPSNQLAFVALGEAYRLSNRLPEAHGAFSQAAAIKELPVVTNRVYGDVLMALKDYQGALKQYTLYGTEYPEASQPLIDKCNFAIAHANDDPSFRIEEEYVNTSKRDFGPAFFGDDIVYLSSRTDMASTSDKTLNKDVKIELLKAAKDAKGMMKYPKRIKSLTGQAFNIAAIAYNPVLRMVAVTKGGQDDNIHLNTKDISTLYIGKYDEHGAITKLKPYEFNMTDYSTGFASFSEDGMTMYLASDRPGGEGGYDIYESRLTGGAWSAPINLGKEVNTAGNEITPSRVGNLLLFSSDYRAGFGGYDVFKAYEGPSGFANAENLGTEINSSFDEYGMIYDINLNIGYLSSTRISGKGMEDIYRLKSIDKLTKAAELQANTTPKQIVPKSYEILKGMTIDQMTGEPIVHVLVKASTDDGSAIVSAKSNDKGMFSIPLEAGEYYNLKFESGAYLTASRTVKMETSRNMPLLKVDLEIDPSKLAADVPNAQSVAFQDILKPRAKENKSNQAAEIKKENEIVAKRDVEETPLMLVQEKSKAKQQVQVEEEEVSESYSFVAPANAEAYAIQIAAISKNESPDRFANVKDLGSLYTLYDSKVYKVRCGLFSTRAEAEEVLRQIKVKGYETAFIVMENPSDSMDLVMMDFKTYTTMQKEDADGLIQVENEDRAKDKAGLPPSQSIATSYKVRLATYSNPKWFDSSKVEGPEFGTVEVVEQNGKSIYLLAGFESLEAANNAQRLALSNGFKDAYVVQDNNGKLSKIK